MNNINPELLKQLYEVSVLIIVLLLLRLVFDFVKYIVQYSQSKKINKEFKGYEGDEGLVGLLKSHIIDKLDGIKIGTERLVTQNEEIKQINRDGFETVNYKLDRVETVIEESNKTLNAHEQTLQTHHKRQITEENLSSIKIMLKKLVEYFKLN